MDTVFTMPSLSHSPSGSVGRGRSDVSLFVINFYSYHASFLHDGDSRQLKTSEVGGVPEVTYYWNDSGMCWSKVTRFYTYAFRAESDKSFEWLERAYKQRDGGLTDQNRSVSEAGLPPSLSPGK